MRHYLVVIVMLTGCAKSGTPPPPPLSPAADLAPTYLSDSDPAYRELENEQRTAYEAINSLPPWGPGWKAAIDNDAVLEALLSQPLATRYENPATFRALQDANAPIAAAAAALNYRVPRLALGTAPTFSTNASTYADPHGSWRAIIFHQELFIAIFAYSASITASEKEVDKELTKASAFFRNAEVLASLMQRYAEADPKIEAPSTEQSNPSDRTRLLYKLMTQFALAHEYGHAIIAEQKRSGELLATSLDVGEPARGVCSSVQSWAEEIEADRVGMRLALHAYAEQFPEDRHLHAYGPILLLTFLHEVERAQRLVATGLDSVSFSDIEERAIQALTSCASEECVDTCEEDRSLAKQMGHLSSHPPGRVRAQLLESWLERKDPELPRDSEFRRHTTEVTEFMWRITKQHLTTRYYQTHGSPHRSSDVKKACVAASEVPSPPPSVSDHEATRALEKACRAGDMKQCCNLGVSYEIGLGVERSASRAVQRYRGACNAGAALCCGHLGRMYLAGSGVAADPTRGAALLERACDAKFMSFCVMLGREYGLGKGLPKDEAKGRELFERACAAGRAEGCVGLSHLLIEGIGGPRDVGRAFMTLRETCNGGDQEACSSFATMYERGVGVEVNRQEAVDLHRKACCGDVEESCKALRRMGEGQ